LSDNFLGIVAPGQVLMISPRFFLKFRSFSGIMRLMRYAWISIAIVAIWLLSAWVIAVRPQSSPEYVLSIAAFGTVILAILGFRTPRFS